MEETIKPCPLYRLPAVIRYGKEAYHPKIELSCGFWIISYITNYHEDFALLAYWGKDLEKVVDKVLEILREYTC